MSAGKILRIYLDKEARTRALAGSFHIMNQIRDTFQDQGYRVEFTRNTDAERAKSVARRGYALFHMDHPFHARALTLRRAYFYPFWRIETTAARWDWAVAASRYDPTTIDTVSAKNFGTFTRKRLFPNLGEIRRTGMVYIPLQGKLLDHRRFQSQSPIDMVRTTLIHERRRDVLVGLHPKETYRQDELDTLKTLIDAEPRLKLANEPMEKILERCDYVVTQNSAVALSGFLLGKPAVLFAKIDFHHIAANVSDLGAGDAIACAPDMAPDFDAYLYWFLKKMAIDAGAPDAKDQILATVRNHGWAL